MSRPNVHRLSDEAGQVLGSAYVKSRDDVRASSMQVRILLFLMNQSKESTRKRDNIGSCWPCQFILLLVLVGHRNEVVVRVREGRPSKLPFR